LTLYCLFFFDIRILITAVVSSNSSLKIFLNFLKNVVPNDLHKTKDRVTRTPLKTGEFWSSGRVSSSCSTIGTRRVDLVTNHMFCVASKYSDSATLRCYNSHLFVLHSSKLCVKLCKIHRFYIRLALGEKVKSRWILVFRKGKQFLLHYWHPSCWSSYKPADKPWMRKGPGSNYDKWNISVVICDTYIPNFTFYDVLIILCSDWRAE
jgi:hypothetical protein